MSSEPHPPNVHKDFHGALSYGLDFLHTAYGDDGMRQFLSGLAESVYWALVEDMKFRGLAALEDHWRNIFALEAGDCDLFLLGGVLTLRVHRCPALHHLRQQGYAESKHFCEHTRIVNEAICRAAGYRTEVQYDQAAGSCVQRFWKEAS